MSCMNYMSALYLFRSLGIQVKEALNRLLTQLLARLFVSLLTAAGVHRDLHINSLEGTLPPSWGNMSSLTHL